MDWSIDYVMVKLNHGIALEFGGLGTNFDHLKIFDESRNLGTQAF